MRILIKIRTNKISSECVNEFEYGIFDLDDNSTPEEIEELAMEAAFEMVDWHYEVIGDANDN